METKLETTNWATRAGATMLGNNIVNAWLVYQRVMNIKETQTEFYTQLEEEVIDNAYDERDRAPIVTILTANIGQSPYDTLTEAPQLGIKAHLNLTKCKHMLKGL